MPPIALLPLAATALLTGVATATDLRDFEVHDALTYPALLHEGIAEATR